MENWLERIGDKLGGIDFSLGVIIIVSIIFVCNTGTQLNRINDNISALNAVIQKTIVQHPNAETPE